MKRYNLLNNVFGWVAFVIAAITYLLTIEPTASFWDCGEFITSSYKLEVGHPPGAPFFNLTAKFFTLFASDPSHVARLVNAMSALLSAATILFLFWTITYMAKKLIYTDNSKEITLGQTIAIIGSGLVGSLAYTYTDTFWFSAVEGEVYAFSSMFTALVFWLILKWENRSDKPGADKWIILIAYMVGLSIGVHLLNLLCIPAMALVYYFKKAKNVDLKGTLIALALSFVLIVILMYGIIPGFTKVGGWFELFFVNTLGLPYNSGALFYILVLIASIIWGVYETMVNKNNVFRSKLSFIICLALAGVPFIGGSAILWVILFIAIIAFIYTRKNLNLRAMNTALLSLMVILIGYSSYALIPIRSSANTPMDQNSPEDVFTVGDYLSREQYGETPLFYGKTYASEVQRDANGSPVIASEKPKYARIVKKSPDEKDRYFVAGTDQQYKYTNEQLFPRMYSNEGRHIQGYKNWGGITDASVPPTLMQNLQYFFSYQLNFMYWRYFMWNFSGRQNDRQNTGGITSGNWITGISFIDEHVLGLGPQDNIAPDVVNNKGHNRYFMLPLLLGIIGIVFQLKKKELGEQGFWITFMLFFMTGIAIVIYLNQKPFEPRERDYAYAGSFYAFAIWIGLGVAGIWELLRKKLPSTPAAIISTVVCLFVPALMAAQNWDDHDRSGRYTMRDFGMNYLRSCAKNAILFTNGDNDTFPLWYAQDVEGFRTDVRVCNLSYLQTDWYVDQMRRQAYDSDPLPIKWDRAHYIGDKGAFAYVITKQQIEAALQKNNVPQHGSLNDLQQLGNAGAITGSGDADLWGQMYDRSAYKDTVPLNTLMANLRTNDLYAPKNPFGISGPIVTGNLLALDVNESKVDWKTLNVEPTKAMLINLGNKNVLYRQELMILEMLNNINNDNWKRPIYFAVTVDDNMYMNMKPNFQQEGLAYRITPGTSKTGVNTEVMYDNMVNKFKWGGIENPKVYLDENNMRSCITYRYMFSQLLQALMTEGKKDKALKALNRCIEVLPPTTIPYGGESAIFGDLYYQLGQPAKGKAILDAIVNRATLNLQWFNRLNPQQTDISSTEIWSNLMALDQVLSAYQRYDRQRYQALKLKMLDFAQLYYSKNNYALGNSLLKNLADGAIQGYYNAEDSSIKHEEEAFVNKSMQMMQRYSPDLLREYQQSKESQQPQHQVQQ